MHTAFDLTGPIVRSRLEPDFYKFTMGQLIWRKYPAVQTTFTFSNRTARVRLGRVLDLGELREQLDHARSLMFTEPELDYLGGIGNSEQRMFADGYLEFLRGLRLPGYHVESRGDQLILEFSGAWAQVSYWETMALSIVSEVYHRTLLRTLSESEREAIFAAGVERLHAKIGVLRERPQITFSDFGTRRRFSGSWQHYVDVTLKDQLNRGSSRGQFLGTSNTFEAMTNRIEPTGTSAHELPMILAGILDDGSEDPEWLRRAQRQVIDDWWEQYGAGLAIFLPDTWGTDFFFSVVKTDDLRRWKGLRWDSGDLFEFGDRVIRAYQENGVDPEEKMLIASDALDLEVILRAQEHFSGRIRISYGWGTGLTNDLLDGVMMNDRWFGPMSLVIKPTRANGRSLVKLSDNPAKAIGPTPEIDRYRRIAGYHDHPAVMPRY